MLQLDSLGTPDGRKKFLIVFPYIYIILSHFYFDRMQSEEVSKKVHFGIPAWS